MSEGVRTPAIPMLSLPPSGQDTMAAQVGAPFAAPILRQILAADRAEAIVAALMLNEALLVAGRSFWLGLDPDQVRSGIDRRRLYWDTRCRRR